MVFITNKNKPMTKTVDWLKKNIEPLLVVGAQIRIGGRYVKECGGFKPGEVITLIEGYFEHDNGLYTETQTAPSIWDKDSEDYDSIYHLFGNDLDLRTSTASPTFRVSSMTIAGR